MARPQVGRPSAHFPSEERPMTTFLRRATLAAATALFVVSGAPAEDRRVIDRKPADKEPTTEKELVARVVSCEVAEVKFAEQAAKQTKSDDVRKFALTILDEHTKSRDAWLEQAKEMKLAVVQGLEKPHRDRSDRL